MEKCIELYNSMKETIEIVKNTLLPHLIDVEIGKKLLEDVVVFSKQKKLVNVRLNTQTQNKHAQSLYLNNGFVYTKTNFLILATSNHK